MMRTEQERAPRRRHRARRLFAAWGLCCLSAVVGLVAAAPPAMAWDVPKPLTNPFATNATSTGSKLTTVCKANTTGCVLLAGAGAFEGTCWILGEVFSDPDGCAEGAETLFSFIPGVSHVDHATYTGPAGIVNPNDYAGAGVEFHPILFMSSSSNDRLYIYWSDPDGTPSANGCYYSISPGAGGVAHTLTLQTPGVGVSAQMNAVRDLVGSGTPSASGCSGLDTSNAYVTGIEYRYPDSATVNAQWIADPGFGDPVTMTYTRYCVGGAAGTGQTLSGSETFVPVAGLASPGVSLPTCQSAYPGSREEKVRAAGDRQGITNPTPMVDVEVGGYTPEQQSEYPLCAGSSMPVGGCQLELMRDGKSCHTGTVYCAGWRQNIVRWNMTCEWGPYLMDMQFCVDKYGDKFDRQPKPPTEPTNPTDPTAPPGTGTNPQNPPTSPDTSTNPDSSGCFGDAFSFNPVDWVYVPVKCAMLWAFKPSTSLQTRVGTVQGAFADAPPFTWFAQLGALPTAIGSSGCPNWRVHVGGYFNENVVCDSTFTDAIRSGRPVFAAMMIAAAFAPFLRSLAYSAVPILSPVPH